MNTKRSTVANLPNEVLERVFSYLPLSDRKSASLVSSLWSELAFNSRSLRNIALKLTSGRTQRNYLSKSSRRYRNLFAFLQPETCCKCDFEWVVEILDLFGEGLESFYCLTKFTEEQLRQVVVRTPNLQQLMIGLEDGTPGDLVNFPELRYLQDLQTFFNVLPIQRMNLPSLTHLSVHFTGSMDARESVMILKQLAPRLKSFGLYSGQYSIPIEELHLPEAEVIELEGEIFEYASDHALKKFFGGFSLLKEVNLFFDVDARVLDLITKSCPGIEILEFWCYPFNPESFIKLERLKNLKSLSIVGSVQPGFTVQCKPLTSVTRFNLEMTNPNCLSAGDIESFRQLLPNVIDLSVTLQDYIGPNGVLEHVCKNFANIKQLSITDEHKYCQVSILEALGHLKRLEEITFRFIHSPVAFMLPNSTLKRLKIYDSRMFFDDDLMTLPDKYPNLKYLELNWCIQVTPWGLADFQKRMPGCVVHCVNKMLQ